MGLIIFLIVAIGGFATATLTMKGYKSDRSWTPSKPLKDE